MTPAPPIGVAIVTFNSRDVILGCLDSLFASGGASLRVVIVDNCSGDDTVALVRNWAARRGETDPAFSFAELPADTGAAPSAALSLLHSEFNGGYAHGVNAGLKLLLRDPALGLFWVLNPDCEVTPNAAARYIAHGADGNFALMSGRTLFKEAIQRVQTDGGRVDRWTGVCRSINAGMPLAEAEPPDARSIDFVTGANCVASRRFVEATGLMAEDYFLYYEEVDWAFRRGKLPLRLVDDVLVYHIGGTTIGSAAIGRPASAFANFFNYRNRIRFLRRHRPIAVPVALAYSAAKAIQLLAKGLRPEAAALLAGAFGLTPPRVVRDRIAPGAARRLAFGAEV